MSFFRLGLAAALLVGVAEGQTVLRRPAQGALVDGYPAYPVPGATSEAVLEEMSGRAAVIFAGTVTAVRVPEDGGGVVAVEFAVSAAVRGVVGGSYVVREWAGLWQDGPRYRVGDRRLMLLHAPGAGGLSSPVDGLDGAIPLVAGEVTASGSTASDGLAGESVDLRWLQAKTLRTVGYGAAGSGVEAQVLEAKAGVPEGGANSASMARVMGLLMAWEAQRHAGR